MLRIICLFFILIQMPLVYAAAEKGPDSVEQKEKKTTKDLSQQMFDQAVLEFRNKKYESSLEKWIKLNKLNPKNNLYRFNLAHCYYALGLFDLAIIEFEKVISNPDYKIIGTLYMAKSLYRRQLYKQSYELLEKLRKEKLSQSVLETVNLDYEHVQSEMNNQETRYFSNGMQQFDNAKFKRAAKYFEKLDHQVSDKPHGHFMLGLTYLKLNNIQKAKDSFDKIEDEKLKETANFLLSSHKPDKKTTPWLFFFSVALGSSDNSTFVADNQNKLTKPETSGYIGLSYDLDRDLSNIFYIGFQSIFGKVLGISDEDYLTNILSLQWGKRFANNWQFTIEPAYEYSRLNGNSNLNKGIATFRISKGFGSYKIGSSYSFNHQKAIEEIDNSSNGQIHQINLYLEHFTTHFRNSIEYSHEVDDLRGSSILVLSRNTNTLKLSSLYKFNLKWSINLSYQYGISNYDLDLIGKVRTDNLSQLRLGPIYDISDQFSTYLEFKHSRNKSNVDLFTYEQIGGVIGLSYFM